MTVLVLHKITDKNNSVHLVHCFSYLLHFMTQYCVDVGYPLVSALVQDLARFKIKRVVDLFIYYFF